MAAQQLFGDGVNDVAEIEGALLLRHPGMKHDLKQEVAQFVAEIVEVAARHGIGDFVGLFDRVWRDAGEILLKVPWAAGARGAQRRHDLQQPSDIARC